MKLSSKILTLVPAVALLLTVFGCNTTGCLDNQSSIPLAGLYSSETNKTITLSNIQVFGIGAPGDSILVMAGESVSQIYLPMRSTANSVAWCFRYAQEGIDTNEFNDTIVFNYSSEPYFASEECGAMYRYTIEHFENTTHLIDSVVVVDSLITNTDTERIKIYFRTRSEQPADNTNDVTQ